MTNAPKRPLGYSNSLTGEPMPHADPPAPSSTRQDLHFIHISDTHIGPTKEDRFLDVSAYSRLRAIVDAINRLQVPVDFVIHTGDVVTDADNPASDEASTRLAHSLLKNLRHTLYVVNGNHDEIQYIDQYFGRGGCSPLGDDKETRGYHFAHGNDRCIVLDARGPKQLDPAGLLSEAQLDAFDELLTTTEEMISVFLHYPPVALDSTWVDRLLLIQNGGLLHERLTACASRVRGVFFGHVHRGMQVLRDGILYCSVASTACQFDAWPNSDEIVVDRPPIPFFNYVTLGQRGTVVKQHWAPVGAAP